MTKEEILAAYGDVQCKFASYYKYSFSFTGIAADGAQVSVSVGGNHDDIYRYHVTPEVLESLNSDQWSFAVVKKDGAELWSESRY